MPVRRKLSIPLPGIVSMSEPSLKRKSFFVDEDAVRRARKALGVATDAEAVRLAIERVAEMEEYWTFMNRSRSKLKKGSIEAA